MAQERIEIKFIAKGNVPLVKAIKELNKATKNLNGQLNKLKGTNVKVAQTQALVTQRTSSNTAAVVANSTAYTRLQSVIAVYRNKMLLASFAAGLVTKGLINLVEKFGKFQDLEKGFNSLGKSINSTSGFLRELRKATNGTVDDMDLMKQANNAMMLGIVKSEEEMAELFDTAQRLGQALGQDTVNSIESLVTGMGRQSRLMLDNLGIIVKQEEASKRYALANNIVGRSLTDNEKKLAFNQEALKQSADIVKELGIEHLDTNQHVAILQVSAARLARTFGEALAPALIVLSKSMAMFANALDTDVVKSFMVAITALSIAFGVKAIATAASTKMMIVQIATIYQLQVAAAGGTVGIGALSGAFATLTTVMMANPYVRAGAALLALALGTLAYLKWTKEATEATVDFNDRVIEADNVNDNYQESVKGNINALQQELDMLNATSEIEKMAIKLKRDLTLGNGGLHASEIALFESLQQRKEELKTIAELEKAEIKRQQEIQRIIEFTATMEVDAGLLRLQTKLALIDAELRHAQAVVIAADIMNESNEASAAAAERMEILEETYAKLSKAVDNYGESEVNVGDIVEETISNTLQGYADFFAGISEMSQQSAQSRIDNITSAEEAEVKALKESTAFHKYSEKRKASEEKTIRDKHEASKAEARKEANKVMLADFRLKQAMSIKEAVMNTSTGYTNALKYEPTGILAGFVAALGAVQIALIASQTPPKMAMGGLVGGNLHSQGGTMIEAERGEFVMSRDAVNTIGAENLNRMNSGGGGGANISFSGNIMSDDFIESEAIPKIKEAIRRGADIGIG